MKFLVALFALVTIATAYEYTNPIAENLVRSRRSYSGGLTHFNGPHCKSAFVGCAPTVKEVPCKASAPAPAYKEETKHSAPAHEAAYSEDNPQYDAPAEELVRSRRSHSDGLTHFNGPHCKSVFVGCAPIVKEVPCKASAPAPAYKKETKHSAPAHEGAYSEDNPQYDAPAAEEVKEDLTVSSSEYTPQYYLPRYSPFHKYY